MFCREEPYYCPETIDVALMEKKLDDVKYWLTALYEQLFDEKNLNIGDVERSLEELGAIVDMPLPKKPLEITRTDDLLNEWKDFNAQYLKQLANHFECI